MYINLYTYTYALKIIPINMIIVRLIWRLKSNAPAPVVHRAEGSQVLQVLQVSVTRNQDATC